MKELLWRTFVYTFLATQLMMLALCSSLVSNFQTLPTVEQLDHPANVSNSIPISLQKTATKSRESAIGLVTFSVLTGEVSFASGTYFKYNDGFFILTAAHAVRKEGVIMMAITQEDQYPCGGVVFYSKESDIAIVESAHIPTRKAIDIEKSVPPYNKWKRSLEVLDPIIYTGYPNGTGPMTIQGKIMGFVEGVVFVNMYAWSGASGSGVFDEKGNIIGIVSALEVGDFGPVQIPLHSSIIVRPTYLVDWEQAFKDYYEKEEE